MPSSFDCSGSESLPVIFDWVVLYFTLYIFSANFDTRNKEKEKKKRKINIYKWLIYVIMYEFDMICRLNYEIQVFFRFKHQVSMFFFYYHLFQFIR